MKPVQVAGPDIINVFVQNFIVFCAVNFPPELAVRGNIRTCPFDVYFYPVFAIGDVLIAGCHVPGIRNIEHAQPVARPGAGISKLRKYDIISCAGNNAGNPKYIPVGHRQTVCVDIESDIVNAGCPANTGLLAINIIDIINGQRHAAG